MPGRQPEDWGIPLWEAIERWTPRELWERYRDLARYDIPLIILGERGDPRSDEARRLRSQISEIMVDRLVRSELIASGIAVPLKETSRRRDIRPELWPRLGFNCGFQMVIGDGLSFDQILIREAASAGSHTPASWQDARWARAAPPRVAGRPGRPSIMPMIEAEMHRRAAHDQIESSLRREAEVLAMWASQEFPDAHVPKPKSIEKGLGRVYQQLRSTKRPDKMGDKL
jgi:hypothetical protein